jgi:hypothetical protein
MNPTESKYTTYIITPTHKKSVCEEQSWCNIIKSGKPVTIKVCNVFRSGEFIIKLTDSEKEELLLKDSVDLSHYDYELIEMWDGGCDFWIDVVDSEQYSEEEANEIDSLLYKWNCNIIDGECSSIECSAMECSAGDCDTDDEEYSYDKLEHNGWDEMDCNVILASVCELTQVDDDIMDGYNI